MLGGAIGVGLATLSIYESGGDVLIPESHVPLLCPKEDASIEDSKCDGVDGTGFHFNI